MPKQEASYRWWTDAGIACNVSFMVRELTLLALAGALGTLSRHGVNVWAARALGERLPYGTLAVNLAGCLLLGFAMQWFAMNDGVSRPVRLMLTVGFLGSFTTFSTFGYETFRYLQEGAVADAALNMSLNLALGLLAVWGGIAAARGLLPSA